MNDTRTRTRGWRILAPVAAAVIALPAMTGCETTTHAQQGEVIGGVLGGVLGSQVGEGSGQTAAIIIGTMAGAMIGLPLLDAVILVVTFGAKNLSHCKPPSSSANARATSNTIAPIPAAM